MNEETLVSYIYSTLGILTGLMTSKLNNLEVIGLVFIILIISKQKIEQINIKKDEKYQKKNKSWWFANAYLPYILIVFALWTILINI
ncbi:MAG: hypothetical protein K0B02_03845 [DPANN group archaeon]|nr:hypothetical protein [DPANN group archaeon]